MRVSVSDSSSAGAVFLSFDAFLREAFGATSDLLAFFLDFREAVRELVSFITNLIGVVSPTILPVAVRLSVR